ncbi:RHTO0S01e01420g1_1 [Rhodotorula toruloides]|uniref:Acyl-protein thioesterase 1 n=1 Tax=Rhodotorula toruloides TaxID=5286 RepID=A0A061ADA0_RHOTO|nr:RHTO0S01e01420g1_1 [Rhodotorula toruloides]
MASPTVLPSLQKHSATIIFLHGLGDSSAGWVPLAAALRQKKQFGHVKFVLPTAPVQPVTANGGYRMTSWFDIQDLGPAGLRAEDDTGMLSSVRSISSLISSEIDSGIPANQIVVGGFSQGAVIGYLTALTSERKLAGVVALSGFLGMADKVKSMLSDHATSLPIFHGHGDADPVVQYKWGQQTIAKLEELGFKSVEFKTYPRMGHSFCDEEQRDLERFLEKVLPAEPSS